MVTRKWYFGKYFGHKSKRYPSHSNKNNRRNQKIPTNIMQTLKKKEEESKEQVAHFTSQLQEMDKSCQTQKLKIDTLERKF